MHELFLEQDMPKRLNYAKFLKFLKLDDSPLLKNSFDSLAGGPNEQLDARVLMLQLMNVTPINKEEKMKFAFNLFDREDSRIITYKELLKILQANYFAGSTDEIESKAKLIMQETQGIEDAITFEDFIALGRKFNALFYPTNL